MEDFIRILKEPKNALAKQYTALLETEGIKLIFTDDALEEVARFAAQVNEKAPRTSARGGCTPSWRSCWRRSPSKART